MEPTSWPRLLTAAAVLALLGLAGCDTPAESLAPVHGRVTYKGQPLPGGTIVFTPDAARGGSGPSARGEIKSDGSYVLRTGDEYGAPPGWHQVTVVAVVAPPHAQAGQKYVHSRSLLPLKYRDPDLSGLRGEVKLGQDNSLDFHLD